MPLCLLLLFSQVQGHNCCKIPEITNSTRQNLPQLLGNKELLHSSTSFFPFLQNWCNWRGQINKCILKFLLFLLIIIITKIIIISITTRTRTRTTIIIIKPTYHKYRWNDQNNRWQYHQNSGYNQQAQLIFHALHNQSHILQIPRLQADSPHLLFFLILIIRRTRNMYFICISMGRENNFFISSLRKWKEKDLSVRDLSWRCCTPCHNHGTKRLKLLVQNLKAPNCTWIASFLLNSIWIPVHINEKNNKRRRKPT